MILTIALAGFIWTVFIGFWVLQAYQTPKEGKERDWRAPALFVGIALVAYHLIQQVPSAMLIGRFIPDDYLTGGLGLVKLTLGLGLAVWARVHLADQWTAIPAVNEETRLIRTGPYKYLRHPIYAGVLGGIWGTAVIFGNMLLFFLLLLVFVGFLIKAHYEERLLEDELGEEYMEYKKGTKMLIPWVL